MDKPNITPTPLTGGEIDPPIVTMETPPLTLSLELKEGHLFSLGVVVAEMCAPPMD